MNLAHDVLAISYLLIGWGVYWALAGATRTDRAISAFLWPLLLLRNIGVQIVRMGRV